ncbi:hypothetical protein EXU85_20350 [Spirosoma sp. KCTC 42546]|uniref:phage tail tube protein n=1 Tax=Spirosoma sp. KCTC 42546 TaxID=2520506 RepID=UPI001157A942|nr:hypothetical protein [Spirosoma sp. KCTC 42546]QDK80831.1 hypothetical protein EXU85_20350 [Spirosoma sp. KCTC 42546]
MALYTIGITSITVGAIAGDGGPGTSLTSLGYTLEKTAKLNQADATVTEFKVEEVDAAVYTKSTPGAITLTWSLANPDVDTMIAVFGGTASGTSPARVWNMPASVVAIEQTIKIIPSDGFKAITIPRGQLTAKLNGELTRDTLFVLDITVTALQPTKSGVGPIQFTQ